ncbi:putative late blight resistance protein homolog R1A-3 [Olea europaea var. sylvestris]|uniref:putative late blight resistance protein homolog R1A-3 n=1 Tax=Olea europaea var. sylvestris TaxID=158386 RepID=UPI000C1D2FBA|nr:putative late blight resistance protein homolog R1A-3 [Olea europaea var. sylvestris]
MAYARVLSLTHILQRTLKYDSSYILPGEKEQIDSLLIKIVYLQDFLHNFPQENIESIEGLERNISDAACQIEDIIESWIAHRVLEESASHSGDIFTTLFHKIEKLIEEVDSIKTRAEKIEDESGIQEDLECSTSLPVSSLKPVSWDQSTMVGLDDAFAEIMDSLVRDSSKLEIVAIVGMGGIGKTSLAHRVYIDKYIVYHFHIRAWLTVSQEYSVRGILLGLLDSMKIQIDERNEKRIDQLGELLYRNLKDRRYLFVMDDVWDIKAWDSVKIYFPDDKTGSRILLTTRLENVANYINSGSPLHRVRFLNDEESWKLFRLKVFGKGFCSIELEEIGKKIAQNCRGLPLAVAVIGGLLSKATKTPHYWRSIAENFSSEMTSNDEQCFKILSLSYKHLPYHLKGCFLYMGIFPEDFEINVKVLIKLWVAEGILKPACSKTLEDVGEEYFLDLVQRSLILDQKKGSNGKIRTCRIHDLLRDLCVREAQKEKFFHVIEGSLYGTQGNTSMRRVSIHDKKTLSSFQFYHAAEGTLQCEDKTLSSVECSFDSRSLKVLHMQKSDHLPDGMEELVNIRYIYCYHTLSIASINKLRNLQTIVCWRYCWNNSASIELPPEIWKMPQLRHVELTDDVLLPDPLSSEIEGEENSIVVLENLQTLSKIKNFRWTDEVLERIPNLRELAINYDYMTAARWKEICINNLVHLTKLESLNYCTELTHPNFLADITFPTSLRKLTLDGIYTSNLPILGSMPNLEVLKLRRSTFLWQEWEPNEGEFLKLKYLLLCDIGLKHWRADSIHFPSLERLVISVLLHSTLDEIPSGFGQILTLQSIELHGCGYSIVESAKKIEEEQLSWGNDAFNLWFEVSEATPADFDAFSVETTCYNGIRKDYIANLTVVVVPGVEEVAPAVAVAFGLSFGFGGQEWGLWIWDRLQSQFVALILIELNQKNSILIYVTLVKKNVPESEHEDFNGGDHNVNDFWNTVEKAHEGSSPRFHCYAGPSTRSTNCSRLVPDDKDLYVEQCSKQRKIYRMLCNGLLRNKTSSLK